MNKVRFEKDGQSIPIEDFAYESNAIRDGFYGLLSGLGVDASKSFVLSGCVFTVTDWLDGGSNKIGDNIAVTEGYIALEGEVLKVDAHNVNVPTGQTCYYSVEVTTSHVSPRKVLGANDFYSQEKRRGKLIASSAPPNDRMDYDAPRIETVLRNKVYHLGMPMLFQPDAIGKSMADYFDESTGQGLPNKEFEGWAMMDGRNGTLDWRAKFIVGYDKDDPEYDLDSTGGEEKHQLTISEMPAHSHTETQRGFPGSSSLDNGYASQTGTGNIEVTKPTSTVGGDQEHENRPPYVVAAWIIRIQ